MIHYAFEWSFLRQPQFAGLLIEGALNTVLLAVLSGVLSLLFGALLAVLRFAPWRRLSLPANALAEGVRNVPALFWILFIYFVGPELLPGSVGEVLHGWPGYMFAAGVLGLTIDNSAYLSDIFRNGMDRVPREQRDAAASCGMSYWQECWWILLPQAARGMLPSVANRMVHNFKNTSLAVAISLPEFTWATQQIESITFKGLETTLLATLLYALGSLSIATMFARLARRADAARPPALGSPAHV